MNEPPLLFSIQRALVVIPAYNERDSILALIDQILQAEPRCDILVIDDHSPDKTGDAVAELNHPRVQLRRRPGKLGYASACREGLERALTGEYDAAVVMDADGSHDPQDIPKLLHELETGSGIAVGSRYVNGVRVLNWPARRLMLSIGASYYVRWLTGLPVRDPTSGFKAIRRPVLEKFPWEQIISEGYSFNIETYYYTWQKGVKIKEVPIVFTERRLGASKMSSAIVWEAVWRVLRLALHRVRL